MKKIKVYYDYQIMFAQKYGGISRYHYELIQNMDSSVYVKVCCLFNRNKYFENVFGKRTCSVNNDRGLFKFLTYLNGVYSLLVMRRCNIIHPTYYSPYILKGLNRKNQKLVITVHDMIHELYPDMFPSEDVTQKFKKKMIYEADHIIAISENTKKDILRFYPDLPESRITVIYHGNSFNNNNYKKIDLPEKYILFVGQRGTYKNFNMFFEAIKKIMEEEKSLSLICVGGGSFSEDEREAAGTYIDRVFQVNVDDETLAYIYMNAECFVFPSLYEGFGFPTLEAFACDCPVLLSNTSSMSEVGGEAAIYFEPTDLNDIYSKIKMVTHDMELRKKMIIMGKKQLEKFNWRDTAEKTMQVYRRVLEEGERRE